MHSQDCVALLSIRIELKWFSRWLAIPMSIWSHRKRTQYLNFIQTKSGYVYNIFFHDQNPSRGHFEPLLSCRSLETKTYLIHGDITYEHVQQLLSIESNMSSIEQALSYNKFTYQHPLLVIDMT